MNTDIKAIATLQQPPPTPNDRTPAHDLLIEVVKERKELGQERHKSPLQPYNGRDQMVDVLQELVDGAAYLINAIQERDDLLRRMRMLEAIAGLARELIESSELRLVPMGAEDVAVSVELLRDMEKAIAQLEGK